MPPEIRARAVGLYRGLRSFFFCPAPLVAWWLWDRLGPEAAFLAAGSIGLAGLVWFLARVRLLRPRGAGGVVAAGSAWRAWFGSWRGCG